MNFKGILAGTAVSYILTLLFLAGSAAAVFFGVLDERVASIIVFCGAAAGVLAGSLVSAKSAQSRILLHSLSVFILFFLLVLTASFLLNGGFALHTRTITLLGSALIASIIGAMFGR